MARAASYMRREEKTGILSCHLTWIGRSAVLEHVYQAFQHIYIIKRDHQKPTNYSESNILQQPSPLPLI